MFLWTPPMGFPVVSISSLLWFKTWTLISKPVTPFIQFFWTVLMNRWSGDKKSRLPFRAKLQRLSPWMGISLQSLSQKFIHVCCVVQCSLLKLTVPPRGCINPLFLLKKFYPIPNICIRFVQEIAITVSSLQNQDLSHTSVDICNVDI